MVVNAKIDSRELEGNILTFLVSQFSAGRIENMSDVSAYADRFTKIAWSDPDNSKLVFEATSLLLEKMPSPNVTIDDLQSVIESMQNAVSILTGSSSRPRASAPAAPVQPQLEVSQAPRANSRQQHQDVEEDVPLMAQEPAPTPRRAPAAATQRSAQRPAVPPEDSVTHDYIVCLEDGKRLSMLKRYLKRNFNMTPEQYIAKWNLPSDYPMVCPAYSESKRQSAIANNLGKSNTSTGRSKKPTRERA